MHSMLARARRVLMLALALPAVPAAAQEAALTPSVTFPAKGRTTVRQQFHSMRHTGNGVDVAQLRLNTSATLGLDRDTSLALRVPLVHREDLRSDTDRLDTFGVDEVTLTLKRRLWQVDHGGYGSTRLGAFVGAHLPAPSGDLGSDSVDPLAGLVFMTIVERHGFNAALTYTLTTAGDSEPILPGASTDDLLQLELAYLYRLSPETYTAETEGAWYALAEVDVNYETNGDRDLVFTPGVLYEAKRWALEVAVHLPAIESLDERPALDYGLVIGWRYLF
ncbi:MAG: hypothetical protein ACF8Q5_02500 [Phycisphaerales bacterium JB040]